MGDRHVPSRVLSNGPDIRPDLNISPDEYVKEEAFQKWMRANDTVLRARTRQSFIAGAICGIFVLVSIIMAGVSLGKIAENGGKLDDHEVRKVNVSKLNDLERRINQTLSEQKTEIANAYKAVEKSCSISSDSTMGTSSTTITTTTTIRCP